LHPASLPETDKDQVVEVLSSERFCDLAPAQVYATLLDEGTYLCSERQMYRVLAERGLVRERRRGGHQRRGADGVPRLEADRPNVVCTWDITKLRGPVKGVRYFLYTILDIYSRCVVGWSVCESESEVHVRRLIQQSCRRQGVEKDQLVIHADRGSPMIAGSVAELLNELGVAKSHSRPRVCLLTGRTTPTGSSRSSTLGPGAALSFLAAQYCRRGVVRLQGRPGGPWPHRPSPLAPRRAPGPRVGGRSGG